MNEDRYLLEIQDHGIDAGKLDDEETGRVQIRLVHPVSEVGPDGLTSCKSMVLNWFADYYHKSTRWKLVLKQILLLFCLRAKLLE